MKKSLILMNFFVVLIFFSSTNLKAEKTVIPLSKPGEPCTLIATLYQGGIKVVGYSGKDIIVNTEVVTKKITGEDEKKTPRPPRIPAEPEIAHEPEKMENLKGLKKISGVSMNISIREEGNVVTISTSSIRLHHTVNLVIEVPFNTSLKLNCYRNGNIVVDRVSGEQEFKNYSGSIELDNISGSVIAETYRGHIRSTFSKIDPDKPMSFSTFRGNIDVTFPASTRANLKLKTDRGDIYTDFDIKTETKSQSRQKRSEDGKHMVTIEKGFFGILNGGGPEFSFITHQGLIIIRKGK